MTDTDKQNAPKTGLFSAFKRGLKKTRENLGAAVGNLLLGGKEISTEALIPLEEALLLADIGLPATARIINHLRTKIERQQLNNSEALFVALQQQLTATLNKNAKPLTIGKQRPFVILVVGVNGAGKTSTIGKLGNLLNNQGYSVLFVAGDTFRAAAIEQLQGWGEQTAIPVIARQRGTHSSAVIFEALSTAQAQNTDVVLIDTAGRLQNKSHLMLELKKNVSVMKKFGASIPHEVIQVIDATTGQNGISQIKEFQAAVNVSGLVVTKLDGTARGGIVVAATEETQIPVLYMGIGEGVDGLKPFNADLFTQALLQDYD